MTTAMMMMVFGMNGTMMTTVAVAVAVVVVAVVVGRIRHGLLKG